MSGEPRSAGTTAVRAVVVLVVAAIGLHLLLRGADMLLGGRAPEGPASSSYATVPEGMAAYHDLLLRAGLPVTRIRTPIAQTDLGPDTTLVLLDPPPLAAADIDAVVAFVRQGGRLLAGVRDAVMLTALLDRPPEASGPGVADAVPLAEAPETEGVAAVRGAGLDAWADTGEATGIVGSLQAAVVVAADVGLGRVLLIADTTPLSNAYLAEADNARFAILLAGSGPVAFAEQVHGFGLEEGIGAIPWNWRVGLAGLGVAALVWMWARGRRLGSPSEQVVQLPSRTEYVESIATLLERAREPAAAAERIRGAARQQLVRRAGLAADASSETLAEAGRRAGLGDDEAQALLGRGGHDDAGLIAAAGALARCYGYERRR